MTMIVNNYYAHSDLKDLMMHGRFECLQNCEHKKLRTSEVRRYINEIFPAGIITAF